MVYLLEHLDNASMVNPRDQDCQEISEQRRLLLKIERKRLVIAVHGLASASEQKIKHAHFDVSHANDDIFELVVLPSIRGPFYHSKSRIVLYTY